MPQIISVSDAGLVLTSPFLAHYFQSVGLAQDRQFLEEGARNKAACLVETLATGIPVTTCRSLTARLLCGIPESAATPVATEPTGFELAVGKRLLEAVLQNWPAVSQTGLEGLRETFLLRDGQWQEGTESDTLLIQRKTLDVLVDQIPWGFSVIHHPWMPRPLRTTW